jgi:hypothetical protein
MYNMHGNDWTRVAAYVGSGARNEQCRKRWTEVLNPDNARLTKGPWTAAEVSFTYRLLICFAFL